MALLTSILSACSNSIGNPTANEIIKENEDADIFQWNDGLVYINASKIERTQELELIKGELLGEITRQTSNRWLFKDGAAVQLPVGTKIYKTNDDDTYNLIIEWEEEEIVYEVLLEG
ncbi:hypothetical protein PGH26_10085 [Sporosarcina jeotgali]|uniref:DUF3221 domain-containing protein n=1 Tax=Sporosarcina jeotgali TaxID=3020056 RepID=A0ABZ0KSH9_9BACL|nr:hypothetical protein [Sporosarcina sp. B2O-1]WOV83274.1 hypothetical protein PGH26_10085 [Sporosarcina sp. B2O-1]